LAVEIGMTLVSIKYRNTVFTNIVAKKRKKMSDLMLDVG